MQRHEFIRRVRVLFILLIGWQTAFPASLFIRSTVAQSTPANQDSARKEKPAVRLKASLPGYKGPSLLRGRPALISFSPDGQTVAISSGERTIKLWDAKTGQLKFTLSGEKDNVGLGGFAYSSDGKTIATRDYSNKAVRLWDADTGQLKMTLEGRKKNLETKWKVGSISFPELPPVAFSPDGQTVLSEREDDIVSLWDVATGKLKATLEHDTRTSAVKDVLKLAIPFKINLPLVLNAAYSPDGRSIVTANGDNSPKLWDASTGKLKATLAGHTDRVYFAQFSPDAKVVATTDLDGVIKFWDAETGQLRTTLGEGKYKLQGPIFSPTGQMAATFYGADTRLWDVATGKLIATLPKSKSDLVAFSPDGKTLATMGESDHYTAKLWDVVTGELKIKLPKSAGKTKSLMFSPDGSIVVTAGDVVRLWDAASGELIATLDDARLPLRFSPDGRTLATGGRNDTALLWEIAQ